MITLHEAIYALNPQVVTIRGEEAFDKDDKPVAYDKAAAQAKLAQMKMNMERNTQVLLAHINNGAKIEVARISAADDDGQSAYLSEEDMAKSMEHPLAPLADAIVRGNQEMVSQIGALVDTINQNQSRPKQVVRGPDGKIQGVI